MLYYLFLRIYLHVTRIRMSHVTVCQVEPPVTSASDKIGRQAITQREMAGRSQNFLFYFLPIFNLCWTIMLNALLFERGFCVSPCRESLLYNDSCVHSVYWGPSVSCTYLASGGWSCGFHETSLSFAQLRKLKSYMTVRR